jgi:tRNA(Glu) U13 pseudouridine synthase TruD
MDKRIDEIVKENPTSLDGKGLYKFRRYGRIDQDDDDEFVDMDEEERRDSATDNEDGPVQTKKADAQRQEEEEEEEGEGQIVMPRPGSVSDLRSREAERQEEEGAEEETAEVQPETSPRKRMATRRSRVSLGEAPGPKRRRMVSLTSSSLPSLSLG